MNNATKPSRNIPKRLATSPVGNDAKKVNVGETDLSFIIQQNVQKAVKEAIPSLVKDVTKAVNDAVSQAIDELKVKCGRLEERVLTLEQAPQQSVADLSGLKDQVKGFKEQLEGAMEVKQQQVDYLNERMKSLNFKSDQLEQYSRVNSVRVFNIKHQRDEDTSELALKCFKDIGVELNREAIDVSHRVKGGTNRGDPDSIIVKLTRREDKISVMRNKKRLKDSTDHKAVYIEEDLTQMRRKMVHLLKITGEPQRNRRVWSIDGKVCARENTPDGHERRIIVNNYQDFLKLEWDDSKCEFIGLYN